MLNGMNPGSSHGIRSGMGWDEIPSTWGGMKDSKNSIFTECAADEDFLKVSRLDKH